MKNLETIFVADGNWYMHRAMATLNTTRPIEEALPYKLFGMIIKDALAVRAQYVMAAFDGDSVFRYRVYKNYKKSRHDAKEIPDTDDGVAAKDLYAYLPDVFKLFDRLGLCYYHPKNYEADDVLCSVAHAYSNKYRVVGGTKDKDSYQWLVLPNTTTYDPSFKGKDKKPKPRYVDAALAEKLKGVSVYQMIDYQMLIGDDGDDVPPIKGMTPSKAKKILAEFGTIANWYKKSKADRPYITAQEVALRRNRKLVTLSTKAVPPQPLDQWKLPKKKSDDQWLSRTYHDYHNFLWPKSRGLFGS